MVIYSVTEFTELVCDDWDKEIDNKIIGIADKNSVKYGKEYKGYPVIGLQEMVDQYYNGEISDTFYHS